MERTRTENAAEDADRNAARLVLVAWPENRESLADALAGGDVAAVILACRAGDESRYADLCKQAVPVVQSKGVAALVCDDSRLAGRSGADGTYYTRIPTDREPIAGDKGGSRNTDRPIVGIGGIATRHDAMLAAERNPDFVLFGRLDGDIRPRPHPKNLSLASWWAPLIEIPCVVMAGSDVESVGECAAAGADFVAVSAAIWQFPDQAAEAVRCANGLLRQARPAREREHSDAS